VANQQHLDILKQGVDVWNEWISEHVDIKPNLRRANLKEADLRGIFLIGADLSYANLKEANLAGAYLNGANLKEANLKEAELDEAHLTGADLSGARLVEANLSGADLEKANLEEADLRGAFLVGTYLNRANLSEANLSGACLIGADLREADLNAALLLGASLNGANLSKTNLCLADLSEANLHSAILVGTAALDANFTDCRVYGVSAWDIQLEGAQQFGLIITPEGQPTITVDSLEIAQFIYLLLQYEKLRDVLNSVVERGVLILGRFGGGGLELLQAIAAKLREMKYLPIIFDFERPDNRDFTETIMTLAGLSRFVIVDLSGPSVPNELRATIPHFKIPFVPIIEKGRKVYSMFPDLLGYPWVLPPVEFTDKEHLLALLASKVIEPAEEKFEERQALLQQLFNR
jgi:uncharacterized protein YjbI with pentapeptide repeats